MRLGAIGPGSAWLLVMEFFAWLWLRFQPKSSLSQW